MQNQFGLTRDIPSDIKRQVRQRDGFGCVVCGKAIYDYEHFDPEFADATTHCVDGITLLCIACHGKKTRGFLSKDTIAAARANPKCKQQGFSFEEFDIGTKSPEIVAGTFKALNVKTLIEIFGHKVLSISPPTEIGMPFRINAHLTDRTGATILEIVDNEWQSSTSNWDVETGGGKLVIRRGLGDIVLALRSEPPNRLVIERLDMFHRGTSVRCREGELIQVITPDGGVMTAGGISAYGCMVGIRVDAGGLKLGVGSISISIEKISFKRQAPYPFNASGGIRRNAPCPCGKGKKYKHCCGKY